MMIVMSDACTIIVILEHNWWLIDDSTSIIGDSRLMLQLVASFTIIIYNHIHKTFIFLTYEGTK